MSAILNEILNDERHGPLPPLLLLLTVVTGLVDAVSYLKLGHIFVANMTGNVVFLGFAFAGAKEFSIPASLVALGAFLLGALAGGRMGVSLGPHRGRLLTIMIAIELALTGGAFAIAIRAGNLDDPSARYPLVALLALAMGLQNATARRVAVPDLTTTVLTLTLTGIAADSPLAGGKNRTPGRRLLATAAMFAGAGIGAFLVLYVATAAALALTLVVLALAGVGAARFYTSQEAWTAGA
jgi:uncharacterized membrane protein YoaK (UPF0700 family)